MFLFFVSDVPAIIEMLLVYASPVLLMGLMIYFFIKSRETPTSISDWKNSNDK